MLLARQQPGQVLCLDVTICCQSGCQGWGCTWYAKLLVMLMSEMLACTELQMPLVQLSATCSAPPMPSKPEAPPVALFPVMLTLCSAQSTLA